MAGFLRHGGISSMSFAIFSQTAAGSAAVSALASLVTEKILKGRAEIGIGRWGNAGKGLGEMMKIWLIMVNYG